jgi:DNA polymerase-3 subunit epsilon
MYQKFKGLQQDQHAGLDELCGIFKIQKVIDTRQLGCI